MVRHGSFGAHKDLGGPTYISFTGHWGGGAENQLPIPEPSHSCRMSPPPGGKSSCPLHSVGIQRAGAAPGMCISEAPLGRAGVAKLGTCWLRGISWSELTGPRACVSRQKESRHPDCPPGQERGSGPVGMTHHCRTQFYSDVKYQFLEFYILNYPRIK